MMCLEFVHWFLPMMRLGKLPGPELNMKSINIGNGKVHVLKGLYGMSSCRERYPFFSNHVLQVP